MHFKGKKCNQCEGQTCFLLGKKLLKVKPMVDVQKLLLEFNCFPCKIQFFLLLLLLLLLCAKKVTTSRLKICIGGEDNSRRAAGPWRTCRRCGSWSRACRFCAPSRRSRRHTPMAPESTLGWTYRRRWNPAGPSPSWGGGEEKKKREWQRIKSMKDEGKQRRWGA